MGRVARGGLAAAKQIIATTTEMANRITNESIGGNR
jgi:hypothetical protein